MTSWHSSNLGDPMLAEAGIDAIVAAFRTRFAGRAPTGAAVWVRHESRGDLHCSLVAYFSPAAADVANAVDASPCPAPASSGLERLIGES